MDMIFYRKLGDTIPWLMQGQARFSNSIKGRTAKRQDSPTASIIGDFLLIIILSKLRLFECLLSTGL